MPVTTLTFIGIGALTLIPFTPLGTAIGLTALPAVYFAYLGVIILGYMILCLIEKYDSKKYPLSELKESGLTSVQGRSRATQELVDYIENK